MDNSRELEKQQSEVDGSRVRTVSKSDFKLARTCEAKLYFRENGYPDRRDWDPYLKLLGQGGYMVEALAKAHYANATQLDYGHDLNREFARTMECLQEDRITVFEGTILSGRRQARADIIDKKGNLVRLLEVKSKSFDGVEHAELLATGKSGVFCTTTKPLRVRSTWEKYIEDIAFQMIILERVLPGIDIRPYLVLVDQSKCAAIDNIPNLFELITKNDQLYSARYTGTTEQLALLDLTTEVDVSAEVALVRGGVEDFAARLESRIDSPLSVYTLGLERGGHCSRCEYRHDNLNPSGFDDCWGSLAKPTPHVLDLFSAGTLKTANKRALVATMFDDGTTSLFDVPIDLLVKADGTVGPTAARQRRQITYTKRNEVFFDRALGVQIANLSGPLNFIDFETSRLALPYHASMRPYGLVTFQWSAHIDRAGTPLAHREWLNDIDVWPNQSFAESLREAIGDEGPVLTWSHFEASVMKEIVTDLDKFGRDVPELVEWIRDVFEHRILDMHEWTRLYYYHPGMGGRTSIKVVLDAVWQTDSELRRQFEVWSGLVADPLRDPYSTLPSISINGVLQDVHEGTGAMTAYQEMMYGTSRRDATARAGWAELLRQYCRLDTLSMVLIYHHWKRLTSEL